MSASLDVQQLRGSVPTMRCDVVVMGAGPYGLSAAAHLRGRELKVAVFGKPISFWREHMPQGMLLRSYWWATSLSDPQRAYSFEAFFRSKGLQASDPLPVEIFIEYGLWFQQHAVPDLDETYVTTIERQDGQFLVTLEDGRVIQCKAVVMAPGLHYYQYCPPEYTHMPSSLVSHSAEHHTLEDFADQKIAIIGRGQAALETAALLNEQGAEVHVIARHAIRWVPLANEKIPAAFRALRAPKAGMGSGWLNLLLEKYPYVFQRLPRNVKDHIFTTRHGPAGSHWLKPRILDKIALHELEQVKKIEEVDGRVKLTLTSGAMLEVDHVILATGYRAEMKQLPMLHASLRDAIQTYQGAPVLNSWFESSVPGLYFIGYSAARSFGPFYRFVVGADAAARRVAAAVSRRVGQSKIEKC